MSTDKPFRKINELVAALAAAEKGMNTGTLKLEGLETACDDARELFERLIVLRHKARESAVGGGPVKIPHEAAADILKQVEPSVKEATRTSDSPTASEPEPVRLDTRPMEVSSRQTSLIEAIENTEQIEPSEKATSKDTSKGSKSEKAPQGKSKAPPSVAEKLEKAAVADLGKAISLSHKFWFVAELFNGDRITYEKSIDKLNAFKNLVEAEAFVQQEVIAKLKKPADPEAVATFTNLVQRRYA
jgi:hypothetical protein